MTSLDGSSCVPRKTYQIRSGLYTEKSDAGQHFIFYICIEKI